MRNYGIVMCMCLALMAYGGLKEEREAARALEKGGNYKEAYDSWLKLLRNPQNTGIQAANDFISACGCLVQLNRVSEYDSLRDEVLALRPKDWEFVARAVSSYNIVSTYGTVIDGVFTRGRNRGSGGRFVNVQEQDRLYWLREIVARPVSGTGDVDNYYSAFSSLLVEYRLNPSDYWQLQSLTDLTVEPDYTVTDVRHRSNGHGVPVNADGSPVFFAEPKSWEDAANDGERWRWVLRQRINAGYAIYALQTMAQAAEDIYGVSLTNRLDEGQITILRSLSDDETYTQVAGAMRRLTLHPDYNPISLYQRIAAMKVSIDLYGAKLARLYERRLQYDTALEWWRKIVATATNTSMVDLAKARIHEIADNWCAFERGRPQLAGSPAEVQLTFRNAVKATFRAYRIDLDKLVDDTWRYAESNPKQVEWWRMHFSDFGQRLTDAKERAKYVLPEPVLTWEETLTPRDGHLDTFVTLKTPLKQAGAYLVYCSVNDGNESSLVMYLRELELVKKELQQDGVLWQLLDARSGAPQPEVELEFLLHAIVWEKRERKLLTRRMTHKTDANGCIILKHKALAVHKDYCSVEVFVRRRGTDGKAVYYGMTNVRASGEHETTFTKHAYHENKVYLMTDRPVYRPGQMVHFKVWKAEVAYGKEEHDNPFAGKTINVKITDGKGADVFLKEVKTDVWGGAECEFALPEDATLGEYSVCEAVNNGQWYSGIGSFRVEEYKKPEYSVTVELPSKPVMLGDKIPLKVKATYYFGAPVTEGTVNLKVTRSRRMAAWCPAGPWDWMYGPGYWWHYGDYTWYPGWKRWGCSRAWLFQRDYWGGEAPDVVLQQECTLSQDGTVEVIIDTAMAKELYGDSDHQYRVTAEVTDRSRRTEVGTGSVTAALKPFRTYVWLNRGYLQVGDSAVASLDARTPDGKPVSGEGVMTLYKIRYNAAGEAMETAVQTWKLTKDTTAATQRFSASEPGQYRLGFVLTDSDGHAEEGGVVFRVTGNGDDGRAFRYNALELIPDKQTYAPGETIRLLVNTEQTDSTVMLFVRAFEGKVPLPKILKIKGKSMVVDIPVAEDDKPNMFVEAYTMANGKLHTVTCEIAIPPEKKVLNVDIRPDKQIYAPGSKGTLKLRITDMQNKPVSGSLVVTVYDKSLEAIAARTSLNIRSFFWDWKYNHYAAWGLLETFYPIALWLDNQQSMRPQLGIDYGYRGIYRSRGGRAEMIKAKSFVDGAASEAKTARIPKPAPAATSALFPSAVMSVVSSALPDRVVAENGLAADVGNTDEQVSLIEPTVRSQFADTALWVGRLDMDEQGVASLEVPMPENLTTWKIQVWCMGKRTEVGEGSTEVITSKDLLIRLQAPRFFVEKDEVVLSANIHNYLAVAKEVTAVLALEGGCLEPLDATKRKVTVDSKGEARMDWRVKVVKSGNVTIRMSALTDTESDAMEQSFPVLVHGADKMVSACVSLRPEQTEGKVVFEVPEARRPDTAKLEIHWSPSLAMAMVDALPYLIAYPYGCTEQTLNRFLPAVQTQRVLKTLNISLSDIQTATANLNSQEHGVPTERKAQWKRYDDAAVFNDDVLASVVRTGVKDLTKMQCHDGGWGWFSGFGEQSWPHTTAQVVRGLLIAKYLCGVKVDNGVLTRGLEWLKTYQDEQVQKLKNAAAKKQPWKECADSMDAFVYRVIAEALAQKAMKQVEMQSVMEDYLMRDKTQLPPYGLSLLGLGLHYLKRESRCAEVLRNLRQYVVEDNENQTAWMNLGGGFWWCWYGDEIETHAAFLKLLAEHEPKGELAPKLVKYLLNNRKHASYWRSTRDTALCLDAFATYAVNSGESEPDMRVDIVLDGKPVASSVINRKNLFTANLSFQLEGEALTSGRHELTVKKTGTGPLYLTSAVSYVSLEDFITAAGLEVKVTRTVSRLVRDDKMLNTAGTQGQVTQTRAEHYRRDVLKPGDAVKSGDLLEIELVLESKNDYEYLLLEDMKAAGTEPVDKRSGYNGNELGAYVEFRDTKVSFFLRTLPRGRRSVTYRLRAETPGVFSALPAQLGAMYAPELRGNSDEFKLNIKDN